MVLFCVFSLVVGGMRNNQVAALMRPCRGGNRLGGWGLLRHRTQVGVCGRPGNVVSGGESEPRRVERSFAALPNLPHQREGTRKIVHRASVMLPVLDGTLKGQCSHLPHRVPQIGPSLAGTSLTGPVVIPFAEERFASCMGGDRVGGRLGGEVAQALGDQVSHKARQALEYVGLAAGLFGFCFGHDSFLSRNGTGRGA